MITLLEKKIENLQEDLKGLEKRKGELAMLIASSPPKLNAQIVLDFLKDFSDLYETFLPPKGPDTFKGLSGMLSSKMTKS